MRPKEFWHEIVANQYKIPDDEDLLTLTNELLAYLGNPDPELREQFAYSILSRWIAVYRYYDIEQLKSIGRWLSTRLDKGIGEIGTDSVFVRSYSASVLSLIMYRDVREQFLDKAAIDSVLQTTELYLLFERDLRSYDAEKGWINAIANTTSLLRYLAMNPKLSRRQLLSIFNTLLQKITQPVAITYNHDEEDRLARVLIPIMMRDEIVLDDYHAWFAAFNEWHTQHESDEHYDAVHNATYQNIKRFLHSLYIQSLLAPRLSENAIQARPELLDTIREFSV